MNAADYFEEFVWPNYERFLAEPSSKYLAMNVVTPLHHMAEWAAAGSATTQQLSVKYVEKKRKKLRDSLIAKSVEFALLEDVATAYKHVVTKKKTACRTRLLTELVRRVTAKVFDTRWSDRASWDDTKRWQDKHESIVVRDKKGVEHDLLLVLNKAVAYWGDDLFGNSPGWQLGDPAQAGPRSDRRCRESLGAVGSDDDVGWHPAKIPC